MSSFNRPPAFDASHPSRSGNGSKGKDMQSKDDKWREDLGLEDDGSGTEASFSDEEYGMKDSQSTLAVVDARKGEKGGVRPPTAPGLKTVSSFKATSFSHTVSQPGAFGQRQTHSKPHEDVFGIREAAFETDGAPQAILTVLQECQLEKAQLGKELANTESKLATSHSRMSAFRMSLSAFFKRIEAAFDSMETKLGETPEGKAVLPVLSEVIRKQRQENQSAQKVFQRGLDDDSAPTALSGDATEDAQRAQTMHLTVLYEKLKEETVQLRDIKRFADALVSCLRAHAGDIPADINDSVGLLASAIEQTPHEETEDAKAGASASGGDVTDAKAAEAIKALRVQVSSDKAKITMLSKEIAKLTEQSNESRIRMAEANAKREALQADVQRLQAELEKSSGDVKATKAVTSSDSSKQSEVMKELTQRLTELQLEREKVLEHNSALALELQHAKGDTAAVDELNRSVARWKARVAELEKNLDDERAASAEQLMRLTAEIKTLQDSNATLQSKAGSASVEVQAVITELQKDVSTKDRELSESRNLVDSLKKQLSSVQTELANASKKLMESGASAANSSDTITKLQTDLAKAKQELQSALAALEKAKDEKTAETQALSLLHKQQLDDRIAQLKEREAAYANLKAQLDKNNAAHASQIELLKSQQKQEGAALRKRLDAVMNLKNKLAQALSHIKAETAALRDSQAAVRREVVDCKLASTSVQSATLAALNREIVKQAEAFAGLQARIKKEAAERRRLHNLVQELRGNIRVYCRVRPALQFEIDTGSSVCIAYPDTNEVQVVNAKRQLKSWEMDEVFRPNSTNEEVYKETESLIVSAMDGYNVCIFAYGQTGSGKTYTMEGTEESRGVNYRALESLFAIRDERKDMRYEFAVSMLEIYNENIQDMLAGKPSADTKVTVREGPSGVFVPGLTLKSVESLEDVLKIMRQGYKNRTTFATNMNEHSSRSHCILSVTLTGTSYVTGQVYSGKLHLVDLAGSERVSKSGVTGDRLKEAQAINKSLSALGDVIQARAEKRSHVPYRNSTLTYLLSDSLGGDSKTLMFVNVSPISANADETFCSLNFASRVRTVELGKASKHVTKGAVPVGKGAGAIGDGTVDDEADTWGADVDVDAESSRGPTPATSSTPTPMAASMTPKVGGGSVRNVMSPTSKPPPAPTSAPTTAAAARRMISAKR